LDSIAKRYGCLPSAVLGTGDSFDLMVYDVGMNWESIQHAKHNKQPLSESQQRRLYGNDKLKAMEERFYGPKD
tara:strand:+ start:751 stop:969 length:219 start_codon:yes stop_codon:yes gene_type:complete